MWLKRVSGKEQFLTFIAEKTFCQVLEQPGQPRGAEQAGQGVPNPAVLPVRHRLRQRDRPDPPSVPSLLAKHLLQGDAGGVCYGGRLLR